MSDDLKTWPETIYLDGREGKDKIRSFSNGLEGVIDWYLKPVYAECIEYMRVDVVKEREEKLLEGAINRGICFGFNKDDIVTEQRLIYEEAGLEELQ